MIAGDGQRIAVIGGGIVGCSCALFLQDDGHAVTLIDPRRPGMGTSFGNAGVISLGSVNPVATADVLRRVPRMLADPMSPLSLRWPYLPRLLPWLVRFALNGRPGRTAELAGHIVALLAHADRAHDLVIQRCGLADLVRPGGWLKVAYDKARLDAAFARDRAVYERIGRDHRMLDRDGVLELEPGLSPQLQAGMWMPENRCVCDPAAYVQGIWRTAQQRGGRHVQAAARGFEHDGDRITAVVTDAGPIAIDAVVLAAGAFSRSLARAGGTGVPLEAERGYHLMLAHPARTLGRAVYTVEGGFVLAPMAAGLRLTGGVELASNDAAPDYRRVRRLLPQAARLVPGLDTTVTSQWQGHRPSLPDSLPVLGRAPARRNLWLAFGHQHIGLTLGPMTGRLIADLVAGRDPGLDLAPYRADRAYA